MTSIGPYIRQHIIPDSMTVSEAARRLGVGRPALSNLLNGKAKLSQTMARKLQRTFGTDALELLRRQATAEERSEQAAHTRANASGYLQINASDIENWVAERQISSRSVLPVLVRRLIHATTDSLMELDFHGDEESERKGWDGEVETDRASEKVPAGRSGWELSCSKDLPRKPTNDINDRERAVEKSERAETTFVFVSGRRWPGKERWAKTRKASGAWNDVRAYDADDLVQWLEQSVATQIWFAEQIGKPIDGTKSLSQCWEEWSQACEPQLPTRLFEGSVEAHKNTLNGWFNDNGGRPLVLTADSTAEALAYLSVAFPRGETDRALVVSTEEALRRTTAAVAGDVIIIDNPELEPLAGPYFKSHRIAIVRPKTNMENDADIALDQIEYESFSQALAEMGYGHEDVSSLSAQSARSATILRRLFAKAPALKRPPWAGKDPGASRKLRPLLFAGAWSKSNKTDCEIVAQLAQKTYEDVEDDIAELAAMLDAPVWAIGTYRGITCRRDALFAAHEAVLEDDIRKFLKWALIILSEDDPALDLEPDQRWSAAIYNKKREISGALHHAIGEMLVLLAVYGDQLFGTHIATLVSQKVRELMENKTTREYLALSPAFQHLAEAAPDTFLDCIEADLNSKEPQLLPLLRSVEAGLMDSPDRTNLLWALELLAWDEASYFRVVRILAKLSQTPINDNWMNKPESSLESLVSCWHPETTVEVDGRIGALKIIMGEFREVGWRVCLAQINLGHQVASPNNRPTYRSIGLHGSRRVTHQELWKVVDASWNLLFNAPAYTASMIDDLLQNFEPDETPEQYREKFVTLLKDWSKNASEKDRASVVRSLRRAGFSPDRSPSESDTPFELELRSIALELQPSDIVERHQWLFAESDVPESRAELLDEKFDYKKREEWIAEHRNTAALEVYEAAGVDGVFQLIESGNASFTVGRHLANGIADDKIPRLTWELLQRRDQANDDKVRSSITGLLLKHGDDGAARIAAAAIDGLPDKSKERANLCLEILLACPFESRTWNLVENSYPDLATRYWSKAVPMSWRLTTEEYERMIDRLLRAKRPRAALAAVRYDIEHVEPKTVGNLLNALVEGGEEEPGTYPVAPYAIETALAHIHKKKALSVDALARLEYIFVNALRHSEHGVPNFEERVAKNPGSFVELVALRYRRNDGGQDPEQFRLPDGADLSAVTGNVYQVLDKISRTPGSDNDGAIDVEELVRWVNEARGMFVDLSREGVGDSCIGRLLGKCPSGNDGVWPHEAVRMALERVGNDKILNGMASAVYNSRGVVMRGPGGDQERVLAEKYKKWSNAVAPQYPFASRLLRKIAAHYSADAQWHDTADNVRRRLGRH